MLDQAKMLKQAWDMKRKMDKIQKELSRQEMVIQHKSVTITITGSQEVKKVDVDVTLLAPDKQHELQSDLKNAINKAIADSQQRMSQEMKSVTGDLNIPGLS